MQSGWKLSLGGKLLSPLPERLAVKLTIRLQHGSLDLLVLPEMALSGYVFSNPTSILPYLEHPTTGPTSTLAKSLAKRIGCHVIAGYPEVLEGSLAAQPPLTPSTSFSSSSALPSSASTSSPPSFRSSEKPENQSGEDEDTGPSSMKALEGEALGVGYNSAVVVSPGGEVIGNYRKTFMFETDKNWARAGMFSFGFQELTRLDDELTGR